MQPPPSPSDPGPAPGQPRGRPLREDWLDEVARRRMPADEAAHWRLELSGRPSEARCLDEELALNALLDALPRPSASPGFTDGVLREIRSNPAREPARSRWVAQIEGVFRGWFRGGLPPQDGFGPSDLLRWMARPATSVLAVLAVLAVSLSWGWDRLQVQRHGAMARTAAEWSGAAAMPGVAVLQDFEAIRLLETRSAPDDVALLQVLRDEAP